MEMTIIPLIQLLPIVATLGFLWWVIVTGHVLEMVVVLLVYLVELFQLVKVCIEMLEYFLTFLITLFVIQLFYRNNLSFFTGPNQWFYNLF